MASLGVKFTWAGEPGDMLVKTVLGWVALGGYLCGLRTESKGRNSLPVDFDVSHLQVPYSFRTCSIWVSGGSRHSAGKSVSIVLGDLLLLEALWKDQRQG